MVIAVQCEVPMWLTHRKEGKLLKKGRKCNFVRCFSTKELDSCVHSFLFLHFSSGKRARAAVETCQLPFTFTEECWRVFTMLSVSTPDKSSQFINKIDGIAYHQFLLCVFPYKLLCQKHPYYLNSSYPLLSSSDVLRCFNIFLIQVSNHTTAGYILISLVQLCKRVIANVWNVAQKTINIL